MSEDPRVELRTAATLLRSRGRIELPNGQDNDTDPVDAEPLAALLETIAQIDPTYPPAQQLARAVLASQQQETQPPTEEAR